MLPQNERLATHFVKNLRDRSDNPARLMLKVSELRDLLDPFDFRYDPTRNTHEAFIDKKLLSVTLEKTMYRILDGDSVVTEVNERDIAGCTPYTILHEDEVECPCIVFVYLPSTDTDTYNTVKMVS